MPDIGAYDAKTHLPKLVERVYEYVDPAARHLSLATLDVRPRKACAALKLGVLP